VFFRFQVLFAISFILIAGVNSIVQADTLRMGIQGFPSFGGNPLANANTPPLYTHAALFDALTYVRNDGVAQPQVAESWSHTNENTWVFRLRSDVVFHNGEPFNAESVVFAIEILKGELGRGYATASEILNLGSARVIDDRTVEITTTAPNPFLPQELSLLKFVAPQHWRDVGPEGFALAPIGTGPFMLEKWGATLISLVAAPQAWRSPKVERLDLYSVPEQTARLQGLLSGRLDVAVGFSPDDVPTLEDAGYRMHVAPDARSIVFAFITVKQSPLQDQRVRQALNHAVHKQQIVDSLMGGYGRVSTQSAPAIAFGYNPSIPSYEYDPDKARRLLAEAGYPNGFSMVGEILAYLPAFQTNIYQQMAADLARVGVNVELRKIPIPQYARGLYQGDWGGEAFGVDYGTAPSLDALRSLNRHSCSWLHPWYCDESLTPLLEQARSTFDLDERLQLTQQVMRHQRDQASGIFLYDVVRFDGLTRHVKGFSVYTDFIPYDQISLDGT